MRINALTKAYYYSTLRKPMTIFRNSTRQMSEILSHRVYKGSKCDNSPHKTAFIMHGILGNKMNWRTFSQKLVAAYPDWTIISIDHRGHGESPSFASPHNLESCAQDVINLAAYLQVSPSIIYGHSFGGKVALEYLKECQNNSNTKTSGQLKIRPPYHVWVLDALPGTKDTDYANRKLTASIETVLPALKSIPVPIKCKKQLIEDLQNAGVQLSEAQWLTTNLKVTTNTGGDGELYEWKMDIDVIEKLFESFLETDYWDFLQYIKPSKGVPTNVHFVQAEKNKMWTEDIIAQLKSLHSKSNGRIHHHFLENSDHWVHIDNPDGLFRIIHSASSINN